MSGGFAMFGWIIVRGLTPTDGEFLAMSRQFNYLYH
jgi:hypothetical protein